MGSPVSRSRAERQRCLPDRFLPEEGLRPNAHKAALTPAGVIPGSGGPHAATSKLVKMPWSKGVACFSLKRQSRDIHGTV